MSSEFPLVQTPLKRDSKSTYNQGQYGLWEPGLSFALPGDLLVSYASRGGWYSLDGGMAILGFNIVTSAFNYTTSSGALQIGPIPFIPHTGQTFGYPGVIVWSGIVLPAGYTQLASYISSGFEYILLMMSGSGQPINSVGNAEVATGSSLILDGSVLYRVNKL